MPEVYDSAGLFTALLRTRGTKRNAERNAIPFVFTVKDVFYVVQPSGFCHVTNPDLHEFEGKWHNMSFDRTDVRKVKQVADATGAAYPSIYKTKKAMANHRRVKPIGWCPSISIIHMFQLPEECYGSVVGIRGEIWRSLLNGTYLLRHMVRIITKAFFSRKTAIWKKEHHSNYGTSLATAA